MIFRRPEGRTTEIYLKHTDRLEILMQKTKADLVTLEENKHFMEYAKWMIAASEKKPVQSAK